MKRNHKSRVIKVQVNIVAYMSAMDPKKKYICKEGFLVIVWAQIHYLTHCVSGRSQGPNCQPPALCFCCLSPLLWRSSWNSISNNGLRLAMSYQSCSAIYPHLNLYWPIKLAPKQTIRTHNSNQEEQYYLDQSDCQNLDSSLA